jgi:hypothetical protein
MQQFDGRVTKHHRFLLRLHLNQIEAVATKDRPSRNRPRSPARFGIPLALKKLYEVSRVAFLFTGGDARRLHALVVPY